MASLSGHSPVNRSTERHLARLWRNTGRLSATRTPGWNTNSTLGAAWEPPGRPRPIVIGCPVERCPMFNWLVRLWHRIDVWTHRRAGIPPPYYRSNLRVRHRWAKVRVTAGEALPFRLLLSV